MCGFHPGRVHLQASHRTLPRWRAAGCGGTTLHQFHRWQICRSLGRALWPFPRRLRPVWGGLSRSGVNRLLKNSRSAAWGHAAYKISLETARCVGPVPSPGEFFNRLLRGVWAVIAGPGTRSKGGALLTPLRTVLDAVSVPLVSRPPIPRQPERLRLPRYRQTLSDSVTSHEPPNIDHSLWEIAVARRLRDPRSLANIISGRS